MKRTSDSYITTLDPMSVSSMQELDLIRKTISKINKRGFDKFQVSVRGRRPYNKVENHSYDRWGNVTGGLANASRLDVYIYKK